MAYFLLIVESYAIFHSQRPISQYVYIIPSLFIAFVTNKLLHTDRSGLLLMWEPSHMLTSSSVYAHLGLNHLNLC